MNFFAQVYKTTRKIPPGKVATYGQIARLLGTGNSQRIGHALHANKNPKTPCHRVVNKNGRLAASFAFGGAGEQKKRLLSEGVEFKSEMCVDLEKHRWKTEQ